MKPDPAPQGGGATGLPEIIAEGRRLEAAATPDDWYQDSDCIRRKSGGYLVCETEYSTRPLEDAAFIAFARNHFKALLDAAEAPNAHAELLEALREIQAIACGELQVASDDTEGMSVIHERATAALNRQPGKTEDL